MNLEKQGQLLERGVSRYSENNVPNLESNKQHCKNQSEIEAFGFFRKKLNRRGASKKGNSQRGH